MKTTIYTYFSNFDNTRSIFTFIYRHNHVKQWYEMSMKNKILYFTLTRFFHRHVQKVQTNYSVGRKSSTRRLGVQLLYDGSIVNNPIYFFICACLVIFFDFLQSDWLQQRAAFYDILTVVQKC